MAKNNPNPPDMTSGTVTRPAFVALVRSGAVRDVQICRDAECDAVDSQWYDDESSEVFLGIYPGPYEKALKDAAEYALTVEENIRLIPVSGRVRLPQDPGPERLVPGPGMQDKDCWAVRRGAYGTSGSDKWSTIKPIHGTLQAAYDMNPPLSDVPSFFMPDELLENTSYADPCYHVSQWEFAPTEQDAMLLLRTQAREALALRALEASVLEGILSAPAAAVGTS